MFVGLLRCFRCAPMDSGRILSGSRLGLRLLIMPETGLRPAFT